MPEYHAPLRDMRFVFDEVLDAYGALQALPTQREFGADLGGVILTLTTVHAEEMEDAQRHPERHRSLRVRMGGLSAYFVALSREHQDVLIHKVKHSL